MSYEITVEGMTCEHCEQSVEEALEGVEGVESAAADRITQTATVEGESDIDSLVSAVDEAGYEASA